MNIRTVRRLQNALSLGFTLAVTFSILCVAGLILWSLASEGFEGLSLELFTSVSPSADAKEGGGLLNAIVGSVIVTALGSLIGSVVGVLAGTYLAEYGRYGIFASISRFVNDVLLSAPSIIIGLFVWTVVVVPTGGDSGLAGAVALAFIMAPVVIRATEDSLLSFPEEIKLAVRSLGLPSAVMLRYAAYPGAMTGILTGIVLGSMRIAGETAPILFTSGGNPSLVFDPRQPMQTLPLSIYLFMTNSSQHWKELAKPGALLLVIMVFGFVALRYLIPAKRKMA